MKPDQKKLVLDIDRGLHESIKLLSRKKYMTLKGWVLQAIAMSLANEKGNEALSGKSSGLEKDLM